MTQPSPGSSPSGPLRLEAVEDANSRSSLKDVKPGTRSGPVCLEGIMNEAAVRTGADASPSGQRFPGHVLAQLEAWMPASPLEWPPGLSS